MASLLATTVAYLQADPALAALLPGRVWDRELRDDQTVRATPGAFTPASAGIRGRRVQPCAVVRVEGVGASAAGTPLVSAFRGTEVGKGRAVTVWLYEAAGGRAAVDAAKLLVHGLLANKVLQTDEGGIFFRWVGDLGSNYDEDLDAEVDYVRFYAATLMGVS